MICPGYVVKDYEKLSRKHGMRIGPRFSEERVDDRSPRSSEWCGGRRLKKHKGELDLQGVIN